MTVPFVRGQKGAYVREKAKSLLKREKTKTPRFLKDKKINQKLWNEMLREIKGQSN